jgi:hypothetical protein
MILGIRHGQDDGDNQMNEEDDNLAHLAHAIKARPNA